MPTHIKSLFGYIFREIRVSSFWSSLNEDVVVDSEVYTDLDPIQAPLWVAQIELNDHVPSLLYKSIEGLLDSCRSRQTIEQLLGKNYTVLQSPGWNYIHFYIGSA